jgi:hypothetical protein
MNDSFPIMTDIINPFAAVLSGGIIELTIGPNSTKMLVHRHLLQKLPYFADLLHDAATSEIVLPDVSEFAAAAAVQFLYGGNLFSDLPNSVEAKIIMAETFIVADRLGLDELANLCAAKIATISIAHSDQLRYWQFVYTHTAVDSRLRIPAWPGLRAKPFVLDPETHGLIGKLDEKYFELLRDLLMLSIHE